MISGDNVLIFPTAATRKATNEPFIPGPAQPQIIDLSSRRSQTTAATRSVNDMLTAGEVWDALSDGRLEVHYQPQYDTASNATVAAEALVRLIDIAGYLVYPDRFIGLTEESDLIIPLGRAVIERVCADLAACRADGFDLQRVAINLSARQLSADGGLLDFIELTLNRHELDYDDLEFELTERQHLTAACDGLRILNALAERGSRIVIDDFGIGYSSVVYLTELPISAFKLDRALVCRLPENQTAQSVVKSLLMLAQDLHLDVVAEGIETAGQNDYLTRAGCRYAQGFGYASPMPIEALHSFMIAHEGIAKTDPVT